ncbi:MAG: class I SAM-dependent methyltransferase [Arachnia sp.]
MNKTATRRHPEEYRLQGHWLLAKLGKRVLRPGGIELTRQLLGAAAPTEGDDIVELGPGVGRTAELLLAAAPASYTGVDPHPEGRSQLDTVLGGRPNARCVTADATDTGLPSSSADLVVGEAMMSMLGSPDKHNVVAEAARILRPGGRYAIHELAFRPDDVPAAVVNEVSKELSRTIKVGARPLTIAGWSSLLEANGLTVAWTASAPMRLVDPSRILRDEGLRGAARFFGNVITNKPARERVRRMRAVFHRHSHHLAGVGIVAVKHTGKVTHDHSH